MPSLNLKVKRSIVTAIVFLLAFFVFSQTALALTSGGDAALDGLEVTGSEGYGESAEDLNEKNLSTEAGKIIGVALAFIGVLFFGLMIYGGFIWMMARGNEQEVAKAKDLITSAIIGLIIVLSAYAITYYIGSVLTDSAE